MGILGGGGNDIRIRYLADTSQVATATSEMGSGISKGLGIAGLGWAAAGAAAVSFGKQSIDAAMEAEEAQARLAAQYAKFPALHDVTLQSLNDLADATLDKSRFDDEAARAAESMLAQYGLTGKQIERLLPLVTDYAAKTGKDLPDAAQAIGKALLGNTRALKDVGISYQSTGDFATDYANIMQLLTDKVGGFAKVDLETPDGKLQQMKNHFGELQESVGRALLPLLDYLAPALIFIFDTLALSLKGWGLAFQALGDLATSVLQAIIAAAEWVVGAFEAVAGAFAWAAGILSSVFGGAVSGVTGLLHILSGVADTVGSVLAGAWDAATGAINAVADAIGWVIDKLHALKRVWDSVSGFIGKLGSIVGLSAPAPPPGASGAPALALGGTGNTRAVSGGVTATAGLTVNVNVHGNVGDPNLIGRRVVDALATYTRTNGTRALHTTLGLT